MGEVKPHTIRFRELNARRKEYRNNAELVSSSGGIMHNKFDIGRQARSSNGGAFGQGHTAQVVKRHALDKSKGLIPKQVLEVMRWGLK